MMKRSPVTLCALFLASVATTSLHAQYDTTWLDASRIELADTTLVGAIMEEDSTRLTVMTASQIRHTISKRMVKSIGPAERKVPMLTSSTRPPFPYDRNWSLLLSVGGRRDDVGLVEVRNDTLLLNAATADMSIPIRNLVHLRQDRGGHFWTGAGIGALAGLALVVASGIGPNMPEGLIPVVAVGPSVVFGLLGGLIGSGVPDIYELDLSNATDDQKRRELERILEEQKR